MGALNYGGRAEIVQAARALAEAVCRGELRAHAIGEEELASRLQTYPLPDPDLIIRTAGEKRLSNFLVWQSAYAELYFTDVLWPEFDRQALVEALRDYQSRVRRFGGLDAG